MAWYRNGKIIHYDPRRDPRVRDPHDDPHVCLNLNAEFLFEMKRNPDAVELAEQIRETTEKNLLAVIEHKNLGELGIDAIRQIELSAPSTQILIDSVIHWTSVALAIMTHTGFKHFHSYWVERNEPQIVKFQKSPIYHEPLFGNNVRSIKVEGEVFSVLLPKEIADEIENSRSPRYWKNNKVNGATRDGARKGDVPEQGILFNLHESGSF